PAVLKEDAQPDDLTEQLLLAQLCCEYKGLQAHAVRFYAEAFAARPELAGDLDNGHRYEAAQAAALGGCGQGADAGNLPDKTRTRLRRQALEWLRADLALWARQADSEARVRQTVQQTLRGWQTDATLAGVREAEALALLPEAERQAWGQFWDEVEALLKK